MLTVTDTACENFKQILKDNPGKFLRVVFEGFGWGGPSLGLVLDELKKEEKTYEINGIDFAIAEQVLPYTKEHKIDYINNARGKGFAIIPHHGGC